MNLSGVNFSESGRYAQSSYRGGGMTDPLSQDLSNNTDTTAGAVRGVRRNIPVSITSFATFDTPVRLLGRRWRIDDTVCHPLIHPDPSLMPGSYDEIPFLVCHLTLQTPDGEEATMVVAPDGEVISLLYGTLVAAPAEMQDRDGAEGIYFAFPDVSVRYVGRFRLRANVMRITG